MNKNRYNKSYIILYDHINKVLNMENIYNYNLPYDINTLIKVKNKSGVYMYNLDNNLVNVFKDELLASKYFNVARHTIQSYIINNTIINNKYILKDSNYFISNYKNYS